MVIAGARPNFMKIAPLLREFKKHSRIIPIVVHTGQHHDPLMSDTFFKSLGIPSPHYSFRGVTASAAAFIGNTIVELDRLYAKEQPDLVLVPGDVNSTLAGALSAHKAGIPVGHVEAGLRSSDRTMPEEINRILVDQISDLLFVSEKSGVDNLSREGINENKVHFVGNVMIDNLIEQLPTIKTLATLPGLTGDFALITLHRPANVDNKNNLRAIINTIKTLTKERSASFVWPMHPRTKLRLEEFGYYEGLKKIKKLIITPPLGYHELIKIMSGSLFILTDSGGIQEEAAFLKIPTITLRNSTERPSTIDCGANTLVDPAALSYLPAAIEHILRRGRGRIVRPELWDGKTSKRITNIILKKFS